MPVTCNSFMLQVNDTFNKRNELSVDYSTEIVHISIKHPLHL